MDGTQEGAVFRKSHGIAAFQRFEGIERAEPQFQTSEFMFLPEPQYPAQRRERCGRAFRGLLSPLEPLISGTGKAKRKTFEDAGILCEPGIERVVHTTPCRKELLFLQAQPFQRREQSLEFVTASSSRAIQSCAQLQRKSPRS